jgi:hypothetical protein
MQRNDTEGEKEREREGETREAQGESMETREIDR